MANDYYYEIAQKINNLVETKQYEQAYKIVSEELNMPYVPKDFLEKLNKLEKEIFSYIDREKDEVLLTKGRVLECLYKGDDEINLALDTLTRGNIRNYIDVIEEYLIDVSANRMVVSFIFEICQKQQLNKNLNFYDEGVLKKINPYMLSLPLDNQLVYDIWNKLSKLFDTENPSFASMCKQVLAQVTYLKYPLPLEGNLDNLVNQIVKYTFIAFNDEEGFKNYCERYKINEKDVIDIKVI